MLVCFFLMEDFNKDYHPQDNHARAKPLIGNPKGYPDHLCAAKLRILLAQPSGDDLVLRTSMVTLRVTIIATLWVTIKHLHAPFGCASETPFIGNSLKRQTKENILLAKIVFLLEIFVLNF